MSIQKKVKALGALPYRDRCLFQADIVALGIPIFEEYTSDPVLHETIKTIKSWHAGDATNYKLKAFASAVYSAYNSYLAEGDTAAATCAAYLACYRADEVEWRPTFDLCAFAVDAGATWEQIEEIYIKHFGEVE